jgi:hypothetical protein
MALQDNRYAIGRDLETQGRRRSRSVWECLVYWCTAAYRRRRRSGMRRAFPTLKSKSARQCPKVAPPRAYPAIGMAERAYLAMINDQGGINGRKINLISVAMVTLPRRLSNRRASLLSKMRLPLSFPASEHPPALSSANISTSERSRGSFRPLARPSEATPSIFCGALAGSRTIRRKARSMVALRSLQDRSRHRAAQRMITAIATRLRIRRSIRRSSGCKRPAPTFCSTTPRQNLLRKRIFSLASRGRLRLCSSLRVSKSRKA